MLSVKRLRPQKNIHNSPIAARLGFSPSDLPDAIRATWIIQAANLTKNFIKKSSPQTP